MLTQHARNNPFRRQATTKQNKQAPGRKYIFSVNGAEEMIQQQRESVYNTLGK